MTPKEFMGLIGRLKALDSCTNADGVEIDIEHILREYAHIQVGIEKKRLLNEIKNIKL